MKNYIGFINGHSGSMRSISRAVPLSTAPTKSPIPVTARFQYFETREDARTHCASVGKLQREIQKNPGGVKERRWFV